MDIPLLLVTNIPFAIKILFYLNRYDIKVKLPVNMG